MKKENIGLVVILGGVAFIGYIWFNRNKPKLADKQLAAKKLEKETVNDVSVHVVVEKRKLTFKERTEFELLEKELELLESEKLSQTAVLSHASASSHELAEAGKKLGMIIESIELKTERWLILSEFN